MQLWICFESHYYIYMHFEAEISGESGGPGMGTFMEGKHFTSCCEGHLYRHRSWFTSECTPMGRGYYHLYLADGGPKAHRDWHFLSAS